MLDHLRDNRSGQSIFTIHQSAVRMRYVVIDLGPRDQNPGSGGSESVLVGWCRTEATARAMALNRARRGEARVVVLDTVEQRIVFPVDSKGKRDAGSRT